jgi:hypothetical protein
VAKPAVIRQAESQKPETGKLKIETGVAPRRELLPHERKHDFAGHVARADTTGRMVARTLRAAFPGYARAVAADAAQRSITDIPNASAGFPHALSSRIEKILGVARRYGYTQVYAERKKATGRGKEIPAQIKMKAARVKSGEPPIAWFNAQAVVSDFVNETSKRARARAIDLMKDGLSGDDLAWATEEDLVKAASGWIDFLGSEAGRAAVAAGRHDAFGELDSEIERYVRSEVIDRNTCDVCADHDGDEWSNYDDIDWQPGDDCEGGDACRGQLIPVFEDEGVVVLE